VWNQNFPPLISSARRGELPEREFAQSERLRAARGRADVAAGWCGSSRQNRGTWDQPRGDRSAGSGVFAVLSSFG